MEWTGLLRKNKMFYPNHPSLAVWKTASLPYNTKYVYICSIENYDYYLRQNAIFIDKWQIVRLDREGACYFNFDGTGHTTKVFDSNVPSVFNLSQKYISLI